MTAPQAAAGTNATLYRSEILSLGQGTAEMFDAGVLIFFGTPCPDALAEVSVVHRAELYPQRDLQIGDTLRVGESEVSIADVGELASTNLRELGHIVIYTDPATKLLPGAVLVNGNIRMPSPGQFIEIEGIL